MRSLKEDMAEDLDNVFLDFEEFADLHEVNGEEIPIVMDEEKMERIRRLQGDIQDGVYQGEVFFFAREKDLGSDVRVNALFTLDGREKFVHSAKLAGGLWNIVLGRRRL
ncbi:MAG: hypothetical protein HFH62_04570 [Lachnospiraceae bacterium]|nr:hypothetical protein [Lachnospiraceae bacterium]